jgi:DNA-binding NtrC family response regulator
MMSMASMRVVLVVDDEPAARYALLRAFEQEYRVVQAASVEEARMRLRADRPDVVLLDHNLPGETGLTLLREMSKDTAAPEAIMITAHGSERLAVEAMKAGAFDYIVKPFDLDELRLVTARAIEHRDLRLEVAGLREIVAGEGQFGAMIGAAAPMRELFHTAGRVAQTDMPVLIAGESGTGKDLLAQEIHRRSARSKQRFVALNCAALPEHLVESELFGHEKGAFTGAAGAHTGKFEQANQGTLFLDEIGDMNASTQAKILRVAESGEVERLGGTRTIQVDVRLISASNKDLQKGIKDGQFREDLYFRLAAVTLFIPPLRQRPGDIPLLVERFWSALRRKYERQGPELSRDVLLRMEELPWPGNVRQLKTTIEKIFVLSGDDRVNAEDISAAIGRQEVSAAPSAEAPYLAADYRDARRLFETEYLARKLREHGNNVTRTAAAIGLERQSLQEKIKTLGLR